MRRIHRHKHLGRRSHYQGDADRGEKGSVVALLCDSGERYRSTILNDVWLAERRLDISREVDAIRRFFETDILQS